jgi:hypothetical protein
MIYNEVVKKKILFSWLKNKPKKMFSDHRKFCEGILKNSRFVFISVKETHKDKEEY